MHRGRPEEASAAGHTLTQAQADSCCAASEQQQSGQSDRSAAAPVLDAPAGPVVIVPPTPPRLVLTEAWRASGPGPSPPVPKHVLLSVFLI